MPSSSPLAWPADWPAQNGPRCNSAFAFVVLLGVACILIGFGFVAIGKVEALKYAFLVGALFLLTAAFGFVTRIRSPRRGANLALTSHEGRPATEIPYSRAIFFIIVAMVACLAALCMLAAIDFATADDKVPAAPVGIVVSGIAAMFFLSFFALVALNRLRRGRILLSERGIYQQGRAFSSFLPWEACAGVKASYNGTPEVLVVAYANAPWQKRQLGGLWKIDTLPPVPMIEINTIDLTSDPNLIYHLMCFYVQNPTARSELGTETSLQRAHDRAFQ